jgi:hypothetical protein
MFSRKGANEMPLTKASLVAKWKTKFPIPPTPEGLAIQDEEFGKLADGIVEEITQNAVVSATVALGIPVATAGTAAAQTGTTTATGAATGTIA